MTHQETHAPFSTIESADIDRNHELLRNGLPFDPSVIRDVLQGKLLLSELHPSLQAIILESFLTGNPVEETVIGDGITSVFALASPPIVGTETIHMNGQFLYRNIDYTLAGISLTFLGSVPLTGDRILVRSDSGSQAALVLLGGFIMTYETIFQSEPTLDAIVQEFFIHGTNKSGGLKEVAKIESLTLTVLGTPVNVNSGTPDNSAIVLTTNAGVIYVWAIGAASGTNALTQIDVSTMTGVVFNVPDATTAIVALATDGIYVYAFMKGGATLQANSVQKIHATTGAMAAVIGPGTPGITTTGISDVAISQAGFLYVSYGDVNGTGTGEVRKFDTGTGALLERFTLDTSPVRPIKIISVLDTIYVLDDLQNKLFKISATDEVSTVVTFAFVPTHIAFDNSDLWVSSGSTLYKVTLAGTILNMIDPQSGKTIQDIMSGLGLIWTTYSDDTVPADANMSKIFPGLPETP